MPPRLLITEPALALVRKLRAEHGPLIFHLSGGCCEGTAPMCFRGNDFRVGPRDVRLGTVLDCPFYVGPSQFTYWANCQVILDITSGGGDSFSLESPEGLRFAVRSRLFTDAERAELAAAEPVDREPLPSCDEPSRLSGGGEH